MPGRPDHSTFRALWVIASRKTLRRYVAAFGAFSLAEWSTWIAALVYAFDRGGATTAGVVAFVMLIPSAVFAPFAAVLGDHLPRERLAFRGMAAQSVAMAVTAAAMLADMPAAIVYAAAAASTALLTITRPAHFSLLPRLSHTPSELTAANAATSVVEGSAAVLSPALAAVILAVASPGAVWLVMAVLMAAASSLIIPDRVGMIDDDFGSLTGSDIVRSGLQGFRTIARTREPRLLMGMAGILTIVEGALDVLIVALAIDGFGRGDSAVGLLNTALGIGGLVGALATTTLVGRRRLAPALLLGGLLYGFGIVSAGATTVFAVAMIGIAVAGAGETFADTAGRTLLQRLVDDKILTRVFGAIEGARMLGLAAGALMVPLLIAAFDERVATVIVGLVLPVFLLLRGRRLLSLDQKASIPERSLELLTPIPMFAELSPEVLERVAAQLTPTAVAAGQAVITQGDVGDKFYVIDTGEVRVTVDGRDIAQLGSGEYFGEIALLGEIPRTATVTASVDSLLRSLESDEFLEAVTGLPRAAVIAHETAQRRIEEIRRQEDE